MLLLSPDLPLTQDEDEKCQGRTAPANLQTFQQKINAYCWAPLRFGGGLLCSKRCLITFVHLKCRLKSTQALWHWLSLRVDMELLERMEHQGVTGRTGWLLSKRKTRGRCRRQKSSQRSSSESQACCCLNLKGNDFYGGKEKKLDSFEKHHFLPPSYKARYFLLLTAVSNSAA